MRTTHTSTFLSQPYTQNILNQLNIDITITNNPYSLKPEDLFEMAARINKKRSFLFVSKVLGKHIPISPSAGLVCGALLADRFLLEVKGETSGKTDTLLSAFLNPLQHYDEDAFVSSKWNPVIIGFAETATALGHAFFNAFTAGDYFHTTREQIENKESVINFEEEHSHATSHRTYIEKDLIDNNREIILVDDEITTGKTAINIIKSIHQQFPRSQYTVVSILDWRTAEHKKEFELLEKELNISIHCVSLMSGTINVDGSANLDGESAKYETERQEGTYHFINIQSILPNRLKSIPSASLAEKSSPSYLQATGRFGLSAHSNKSNFPAFREIGAYLESLRAGSRSLVLGTGEFMYLPMKMASYMGEGVFYHSTTRSPIFPCYKEGYGAKNAFMFPNPQDQSIMNYVYNIAPGNYDDIFLFFEREVPKQQLLSFLELLSSAVPDIKVVYLNGEEDR
ncbi:MAG: phosphoribosyltransferase family protein [Cytobacillus gottheilii]|uniref:phosphoribosyltransferase family protein n=1 Tax=Cytobacillus gottheilii TaxID=859144 RepID=UPI00082E3430|nr:phosphoribosyltransferase family protein [Cytobacillus gottheilii]